MTDHPVSQGTTIPEDANNINLVEVVSFQFADRDGNPIGEPSKGYAELVVDDQLGPTLNIYTSREQP